MNSVHESLEVLDLGTCAGELAGELPGGAGNLLVLPGGGGNNPKPPAVLNFPFGVVVSVPSFF